MFTGIIEALGKLEAIQSKNGLCVLSISSSISSELKPGQSVAHNGVCLSVEDIKESSYQVSVISETLKKTMLGSLKIGETINLERALALGQRLDGHFVQGHIDTTGSVRELIQQQGKYEIRVEYPAKCTGLLIPQGSIALHGISLTVAALDPEQNCFSVCIIPHTYQNTNLSAWQKGSVLNIEFDILGKYIQSLSRSAKP